MAGDRMIFYLHGLGTVLVLTATITLMAAVFTNNWVVPNVGGTGFVKAGLWKICFFKHRINGEFLANSLNVNGCFDYRHEVFRSLRDKIHPPWLVAVKGVLVTTLFSNVFLLFCSAYFLLLQRDAIIIPIIILTWISSILISSGTTLFRYSAEDRYWLPLPKSNSLDTSYNTAVASVFLMLLASVTYTLEAIAIFRSRPKSMSRY